MKMCLRSGFCCKQAPCPFGKWDAGKHQCAFLEGDVPGNYRCGIYSEIVKDPRSGMSPAFGAGCSSTLFNDDRTKVLLQQKKEKENE